MSNIHRIQRRLEELELPAILVSDISSVQWATGFTGSSGFLIATPHRARFVTDSRYAQQSAEQVPSAERAIYASPVTATEFLAEQVRDMGIGIIGFESASVTVDTYDAWRKAFAPATLTPAKDVIPALRMIKSAEEIEKVRSACKLIDQCLEYVAHKIQPGVTEYDLGLEIEFFIRRQGAEIAFTPIIVSGERSARPHGKASERQLQNGDFLTLDIGARVDGYNSDITRTFVIGEATERHREIYQQVLDANVECIAAMKPGGKAADLDALARQILDRTGLAKYFGHGLGHGLGRLVHDEGRMNKTSADIFAAGQIWTVEPGVYIEGFGGVRVEDDVLITDNGVEVLTAFPKQLRCLPDR